MLGKLIKHEWRETRFVSLVLLTGLALVTILGCLSFLSPMWHRIAEDEYILDQGSRTADIFSILFLILYLFMIAGVSVGFTIYLAVHFYRKMYQSRGYLTHTLPVTKNALMFAQVLADSLRMLLLSAAVTLSLFILGSSFLHVLELDKEGITIGSCLSFVGGNLSEMIRALTGAERTHMTAMLIMVILSAVLSPVFSLISIYAAISLGQLSQKHRVLFAVLFYFVLGFIKSSVDAILGQGILFASLVESGKDTYSLWGSMGIRLSEDVIYAVILYMATCYIMKKRLNLE